MKPNKLLLIITIICVTPLIIMSTNNDVEIVSQLKPVPNTVTKAKANSNELDLEVGDNYFDIKVKVPHYNILAEPNNNIVIESKDHTFTLDKKATITTTKYNIDQASKIINIAIKK